MAGEHELPPVIGSGPGTEGAVRVATYEGKVMIGFDNPKDRDTILWAALDADAALGFAASVVKAALNSGAAPEAFLDRVLWLIRAQKGAQ